MISIATTSPNRTGLYDIFGVFFMAKSTLSKLKICLIPNFRWFLLINDYKSQKNEFDY